ncbi:MAG: glycosyltransferase [Actinomycetota bacterium]
MPDQESRERAALAAEALRGRKAANRARTAEARVEDLTAQLLAAKEELAETKQQRRTDRQADRDERARLTRQLEAANDAQAAARSEVATLKTELNQTRDRLHVVYNLKWNRFGQLLREVRQRPIRIVKLPGRFLALLRSDGGSAIPGRRRRLLRAKDLLDHDDRTPEDDDHLAWLFGNGEAGPESGADADIDQRRDQLTDLVLDSGERYSTTLLIRSAVRRGHAGAIADKLADRTTISAPAGQIEQLAESLHDQGEIDRPARLLDGLAQPASAKLNELRSRRLREVEILADGITVADPSVRRPAGEPGVESLYLLHNSLPHQSGGYATRTHGLLTGLNRSGHAVVGVTRPGFPSEGGVFRQRPGIEPFDVVDDVRYERLIGPVGHLPRVDLDGFVQTYASMLQPVIDAHRPQLLHGASNWWNGHAATAVARSLSIPSVYEVRGLWEVTRASRQAEWGDSDIYRLDAMYEAEAARSADRVIAITEGLRDELVRRGVDGSTITIVPNAVDVDRFAALERDDELAAELGLADTFVVGFVGSMTFYEGLDDLLDAIAATPKLTSTPIAMLFVGDGPVQDDLRAKAAALGIEDRCRFVGRVPHETVGRYLSLIDVTPFPRKPLPVCEMVSPLKPLESMASRIPVIVSEVQALAEMVPDDRCGIVVPRSDTHALAEAIATLADDPDRCRSLADNAFEWVRAERSWEVISARVGALYDDLLG